MQCVLSSSWKKEFDLSALPNGLYVLQIISGDHIQNVKLVLE
ncbi:MAG: hypothetical protein ACKOQ6_04735 [Bacteroidota bacterium]